MSVVVVGIICFIIGLCLGVAMMGFMAGVGYNNKIEELEREKEVKNDVE